METYLTVYLRKLNVFVSYDLVSIQKVEVERCGYVSVREEWACGCLYSLKDMYRKICGRIISNGHKWKQPECLSAVEWVNTWQCA